MFSIVVVGDLGNYNGKSGEHHVYKAHLYFEVLFAFDQPIEDSLVVELSFSNGLDDGDDVE
jgi:hypothetical protein